MLVEKKVFTMPTYTTVGGATISDVRVGYECYGELNAAGDNAIMICHYFSGNSHCAGKYTVDDPLSGYWDDVIGPGKAIDTDRWFVVSSDTLCNIGANNPTVVTTGPASIDSTTGKPYGLRFPPVLVRDFVHVQKALADALGIKRFRAVVGPSFGSAQALEWGAQYPQMVERVVAVVSPGLRAPAYLIGTVQNLVREVMDDPEWKNGDYYGGAGPVRGMVRALRHLTMMNQSPTWAEATFGRRWAGPESDPLQDFSNSYLIDAGLEKFCQDRMSEVDPNCFLYWSRAVATYAVDECGGNAAALRAPVLLIPCRSDLLIHPQHAHGAKKELQAQGTPVELFELDSDGGHYACILDFTSAHPVIREFLEREN